MNMSTILTWLRGKKTFALSGLAVVFALASFWAGSMDANTTIVSVMGALGLSTLRSGMSAEIENLLINMLTQAKEKLPVAPEAAKTAIADASPVIADIEAGKTSVAEIAMDAAPTVIKNAL